LKLAVEDDMNEEVEDSIVDSNPQNNVSASSSSKKKKKKSKKVKSKPIVNSPNQGKEEDIDEIIQK
jgi:hypothetical protein